MPLPESVRAALEAIRAHRLRSVLTSIGVVIGVASVVTVTGLIRGFSDIVSRQFDDMGGNTLTVRARNDFKDVLQGKTHVLRFDDVEAIAARAPSVQLLCPMFALGNAALRAGAATANAQVLATTPNYQDVNRRFVARGRFIGPADETGARRVAVIGDKLVETLNLQGDPVGRYIQFRDEWFLVIGVMERRGEILGLSQDEFVMVPYKTGRSLIGHERQPDLFIGVGLKADVSEAEARRQLERVLRSAHRLGPRDRNDFEVIASDHLLKSFAQLTDGFTIVAVGVVGLSLLVGGIGIMNIMLVSVTERTREIGILKALGARRRDILAQFVTEAMLLSGAGGAVGLAIAYALVGLTAWLVPAFPATAIPLWLAALALTFAAAIGLVFGVVPASRAADLDPVQALRFE